MRLSGSKPSLPTRPSLLDGESRVVRYLRLSVTDRCSFRCRYCMPAEGVSFEPRQALLNFEELERLVRCFVSMGITKVRLTGGEPLLRRNLEALIRNLANISGLDDLAMTTNGLGLAEVAPTLRAAGLNRVNVSLDSLNAERFDAVTRTKGLLPRVLASVAAARDAGFSPVKINTVVVRGFNDGELADMVRYAADVGAVLRLTEFMPIGTDEFWGPETFVPVAEMLRTLGRDFEIGPALGYANALGTPGGGPAVYRDVRPLKGGPSVRVGFITALSHNFCSSCNRVRVSATGALRECLAYPAGLSLRTMLRSGASDEEVVESIKGALYGKGPGHLYAWEHGAVRTLEPMSAIGG